MGKNMEVESLLEAARRDYDELVSRGLSLNLTRGKPSPEQLDASSDLAMSALTITRAADGTDCRNYGGLTGLPELKEMFAPLIGLSPEQVIVGGNSSLELMHDTLVACLLGGTSGGGEPWVGQRPVKFLAPTPGYDRHFALCEHFGIELVEVPLTGEGPDMAVVKDLVAKDASIKGMWCVPQYSNPTGETYSDDVVKALAAMETAAPDFRLFWDNAYAIHHLLGGADHVASIVAACEKAGNPLRPIVFASTSKVTFAGSGVAFVGGAEETVAWWLSHAKVRTIGPDKMNQLRHVKFFGSTEGVVKHMTAHAELLTPKFEAVDKALTMQLDGTGLATWTKPRGGYFVSLDVTPGTATRVVELAKAAGIELTPAGSTIPGKDTQDANLRLAPSFPSLRDVEVAMAGVATCVRVAGYEKAAAQ